MTDELADALRTCPYCLHRVELAGDDDLYAICPCGITKLET